MSGKIRWNIIFIQASVFLCLLAAVTYWWYWTNEEAAVPYGLSDSYARINVNGNYLSDSDDIETMIDTLVDICTKNDAVIVLTSTTQNTLEILDGNKTFQNSFSSKQENEGRYPGDITNDEVIAGIWLTEGNILTSVYNTGDTISVNGEDLVISGVLPRTSLLWSENVAFVCDLRSAKTWSAADLLGNVYVDSDKSISATAVLVKKAFEQAGYYVSSVEYPEGSDSGILSKVFSLPYTMLVLFGIACVGLNGLFAWHYFFSGRKKEILLCGYLGGRGPVIFLEFVFCVFRHTLIACAAGTVCYYILYTIYWSSLSEMGFMLPLLPVICVILFQLVLNEAVCSAMWLFSGITSFARRVSSERRLKKLMRENA